MSRYTARDIRTIVSQISVEAKEQGLLPMDHILLYFPGNVTNGHAAVVAEHDAEAKWVHGTSFLPEFSYKTGPTEQYKRLEAVLNVFFALRRQRESMAQAIRGQ